MSNINKILIALLLAGGSGGARVCAEECLTLLPDEGRALQYKLEDLHKITFDGDLMTIEHSGGSETIPVDDIASMRFDMELSSETCAEAFLEEGLSVSASQGKVYVAASGDIPVTVTVYDIQGRLVQRTEHAGSCEIDFTARNKGVYIIKANDKTIKYTNL